MCCCAALLSGFLPDFITLPPSHPLVQPLLPLQLPTTDEPTAFCSPSLSFSIYLFFFRALQHVESIAFSSTVSGVYSLFIHNTKLYYSIAVTYRVKPLRQQTYSPAALRSDTVFGFFFFFTQTVDFVTADKICLR